MSLSDSGPKQTPGSRYAALAAAIGRATMGDTAALARLNPEAALLPHQVAAAVRALLAAGIEPDGWHRDTWQRWALIAHGIALAGHDGRRPLGVQLAEAGVAESRVTKLLTARDRAFTALLPRLLRLLASKSVAPNWNQLGPLIHQQASPDTEAQARAEGIRLEVARRYFAAIQK